MAKDKGGSGGGPAADEGSTQAADELFESKSQELLANFDVDVTQLGGGLRAFVLDLFKLRPKPWDAMLEDEQRSVAKGINLSVDEALAEVALAIAQQGQHSIHARLDKFAGKGGKYQANLIAQGGPEMAMELAKLDGKTVLIIDADSREFSGGGDIGTAPDQAPLEFDESEGAAQGEGEGEGGGEDISLDPGDDELGGDQES